MHRCNVSEIDADLPGVVVFAERAARLPTARGE